MSNRKRSRSIEGNREVGACFEQSASEAFTNVAANAKHAPTCESRYQLVRNEFLAILVERRIFVPYTIKDDELPEGTAGRPNAIHKPNEILASSHIRCEINENMTVLSGSSENLIGVWKPTFGRPRSPSSYKYSEDL